MKFSTKENITKIEKYISDNKDKILADLMALVRIPSIKGEPSENAPFGKECAEVLTAVKKLFEDNGFRTDVNSEYGYALSYFGNAGKKDIGLFSHGDVVPVGGEWLVCKPFEPVIKDGFVFGRGTSDDKAGIITALYVAKLIKELGFEFNNRLVMFTGSNEETGMADIDAFAKYEKMPDACVVPDGEYPCISGEKSMIDFTMQSKTPFKCIKKFYGGVAFNIIIDEVTAEIEYSENLYNEIKEVCGDDKDFAVSSDGNTISVVSKGMSKHAAYPEGSVNAAVQMAKMLCKCMTLCESDRGVLGDFVRLTENYYGEGFCIQHEDKVFGKLTCANGIVGMTDNKLAAVYNIRFGTTCDAIKTRDRIADILKENWTHTEISVNEGYNIEDDNPVKIAVENTYRHISGNRDAMAEKCAGGTYSRHLKNALAVGVAVPYLAKTPDLPAGHGGMHQPDEALHIDSFLESIKMIACMVMELDSIL